MSFQCTDIWLIHPPPPPTHPIPPNFFHRWGEICLRPQNHWWKEPGAVGKKMQPSFCSWYLPMGNYGICLHHVLTFQQSTFYSFPIYGTQMNVSENETNNRRNNKKYKVSKNCIVKTRRDIKQAFVCNSLENPFSRYQSEVLSPVFKKPRLANIFEVINQKLWHSLDQQWIGLSIFISQLCPTRLHRKKSWVQTCENIII